MGGCHPYVPHTLASESSDSSIHFAGGEICRAWFTGANCHGICSHNLSVSTHCSCVESELLAEGNGSIVVVPSVMATYRVKSATITDPRHICCVSSGPEWRDLVSITNRKITINAVLQQRLRLGIAFRGWTLVACATVSTIAASVAALWRAPACKIPVVAYYFDMLQRWWKGA